MHWGIQDFKGLTSAELDLRPGTLTVLAGINSSGKSSLLQSVLFAAQSLYNDGPVVLNGPLVRLGEAPDLLREGSSNNFIRITLQFRPDDPESVPVDSDMRGNIDLVPSGDGVTLRPQRVGIELPNSVHTLSLDKNHSRSSDLEVATSALSDSKATDLLHVKSLAASDKRALRTYVSFRGLVPVDVIQLYKADETATKYRQALQPILDQILTPKSLAEATTRSQGETEIHLVVREFVRLVDAELADKDETTRASLRRMLEARTGNPYLFEDAWKKLSREDRSMAVDMAVKARSRRPFVRLPLLEILAFRARRRASRGLLEVRLEELMESSLVALRSLASELFKLADRVQYLGPLRDEPRVVWNQWNELARGLPVGTRGEYSAVVLSRSANHRVRYTTPLGVISTSTLNLAVNEWLAYLEIGDGVTAQSLGKLGVGVKLSLSGQMRDLTAVGVGVSQALPLVVAVLAAPYGSIFMVEQPELHLHPAVQGRLADFMLFARPDLTTVVETHSEAFLTRIRRRVAEGILDGERVNVTFVETSESGASTRDLRVTEFGDLNEWPTGFLTSSEEDTSAILRANLHRLKGTKVAG